MITEEFTKEERHFIAKTLIVSTPAHWETDEETYKKNEEMIGEIFRKMGKGYMSISGKVIK